MRSGEKRKEKVKFEKYTAREVPFKPNMLTSNINYFPKFEQVDKKHPPGPCFAKMVGRTAGRRAGAESSGWPFGDSRSAASLRREGGHYDMRKTLPRETNSGSKYPSWMQKGVFLRGVPNEKHHLPLLGLQSADAVAETCKAVLSPQPKPPPETAEKYLAAFYLHANKLFSLHPPLSLQTA